MAKRDLIWSERALKEYDMLLDYLWEEWGEDITLRVRDEIDKTVLRIQNSPEQFPVVLKSKKIHRCVASPQTSIFFKARKKTIEILSLFDNRRDPKTRNL